jgi:hypothetical protein
VFVTDAAIARRVSTETLLWSGDCTTLQRIETVRE